MNKQLLTTVVVGLGVAGLTKLVVKGVKKRREQKEENVTLIDLEEQDNE